MAAVFFNKVLAVYRLLFTYISAAERNSGVYERKKAGVTTFTITVSVITPTIWYLAFGSVAR